MKRPAYYHKGYGVYLGWVENCEPKIAKFESLSDAKDYKKQLMAHWMVTGEYDSSAYFFQFLVEGKYISFDSPVDENPNIFAIGTEQNSMHNYD